MSQDKIIVRGARQHNLQGIDVEIPRDQLVVLTGPSGSGKSSLAFDTIYAEGQRRYVESLSAYARQFLNQQSKPDVDSIEGLSPAISIEQRSTSRNPRSTVGTITEIYDYLRLLYARGGEPRCPVCQAPVGGQSAEQIVDAILDDPPGERFLILGPVVRDRKGEHREVLDGLASEGFVRVRVDGEMLELEEVGLLEKNFKHSIDVVVDRLKHSPGSPVSESLRSRLTQAVELALKLGKGLVDVASTEGVERRYSELNACPEHGFSFPPLEPRLFSFNNPAGACSACDGLGDERAFDPQMVVPEPEIGVREGAIAPWNLMHSGWYLTMVESLARHDGVDLGCAWRDLPPAFRQRVLYGSGREAIPMEFKRRGRMVRFQKRFEGVIPNLRRRLKETQSENVRESLRQYQSVKPCAACDGTRLRLEARQVFVGELNLPSVGELAIDECLAHFEGLELVGKQAAVAKPILREVIERLKFLVSVGLNYLNLSRMAGSLSGGEAQRIRLATQIGSALTGVLYVLDEPSIGLHQRDNTKLLESLKRLRDLGNTVLVVEHDEETMWAADHLVDLGPGAGIHGGVIVAQGSPEEVVAVENSLTGAFLSGREQIGHQSAERSGKGESIRLTKASGNNLQQVDVEIPLGCLVAVTGVSGSGKSSLIMQTLQPAIRKALAPNEYRKERPLPFDRLEGLDAIDKLIPISQSPIGRTPRSNPATYTGLFTDIRELYSSLPESKIRGFKPGRFSFNVKGGRCETCQGAGVLRIEMHFLPDLFVTCDACAGRRYNTETLAVDYRDHNIADLLDLTVLEARKLLDAFPRLCRKLDTLIDVGLGYIHLGQPATTLSGGEAQRIKLAKELSRRSHGRTLYILDEPTTGLHFDDIRKLLSVLHRLVDAGNTVLVIEHNLDVIQSADHVIDLGPEGGAGGGHIVAQGSPKSLARRKKSHTGRYLKEYFRRQRDH
ncbi:MAG: excinuclease ABC subunit UvrA [Myxococcota bacterium]|nr:excinuclease ABC subunit UvrA [Myxococcota bacterium]